MAGPSSVSSKSSSTSTSNTSKSAESKSKSDSSSQTKSNDDASSSTTADKLASSDTSADSIKNKPTTEEKLSGVGSLDAAVRGASSTAKDAANDDSNTKVGGKVDKKVDTNKTDSKANEDSGSDTDTNIAPIASGAGRAVRGELSNPALKASGAYEAYKDLGADQLAGPDDIRLKQLKRGVDASNNEFKNIVESADVPDSKTYGRAKGPGSIFAKMNQQDLKIGGLDDLSATRIDVTVTKPGMVDVYGAQSQAAATVGDDLSLNKDFIKNPTRAGYSGRLHSNLTDASGLTHELQVGTKDLSAFIDKGLATKGGDTISVHDALYKSDVYGIPADKALKKDYANLMQDITKANKAGQEMADVADLNQRVTKFYSEVESILPEKLNTAPEPTLSSRAQLGNKLNKGFGALGVVGGGLQTYSGVSTLANGGDKVEGVADVVAGNAGIVSGGAMMVGRLGLGMLAPEMAMLKKASLVQSKQARVLR